MAKTIKIKKSDMIMMIEYFVARLAHLVQVAQIEVTSLKDEPVNQEVVNMLLAAKFLLAMFPADWMTACEEEGDDDGEMVVSLPGPWSAAADN